MERKYTRNSATGPYLLIAETDIWHAAACTIDPALAKEAKKPLLPWARTPHRLLHAVQIPKEYSLYITIFRGAFGENSDARRIHCRVGDALTERCIATTRFRRPAVSGILGTLNERINLDRGEFYLLSLLNSCKYRLLQWCPSLQIHFVSLSQEQRLKYVGSPDYSHVPHNFLL